MYQDLDYYFNSIFYERPDIPAKLLSDLFLNTKRNRYKCYKSKRTIP